MNVYNENKVVASLNFLEKRISTFVNLITGLIVIILMLPFGIILNNHNSSIYYLLLIVILLLPCTYLHEGIHYVFQWVFSKKKPIMGFKWPFPYSALSPDSSLSRNQAIISALAPLFLVTIILVSPAIFLPFLPKTILIAWASVEVASCVGDLYLVFWLLKYPRYTRLKNINLVNVLFKTDS